MRSQLQLSARLKQGVQDAEIATAGAPVGRHVGLEVFRCMFYFRSRHGCHSIPPRAFAPTHSYWKKPLMNVFPAADTSSREASRRPAAGPVAAGSGRMFGWPAGLRREHLYYL